MCAIAETATPRRMGAALTYARRYALFTLVGIAGEDDLDAPDLNPNFEGARKIDLAALNIAAPMQRKSESTTGSKIRSTNSAPGPRDKSLRPSRAMLGPEQSSELREQLLATAAQLQSEEEAADWVHKNMPAKNTLIAADFYLVESAFEDKLASTQSMQASVEEPAGLVAGDGSATASEQIFVETMEASAAAPIVLPQKPEARERRVTAISLPPRSCGCGRAGSSPTGGGRRSGWPGGSRRSGLAGSSGNMLWLMNLRFDFVLLGALAGPAVLGIYAVASKFAELMRLVPTAVNYVLYPRYARLGRVKATAEARKVLPLVTALTVLMTPLVAVATYIAIPILYGKAYHGAILPAEIIIIGLSIEGAAAVSSAYLLGLGRPGLNSVGMGVGAVITVTMDVILIPRWGAVGGAITSAVTYLTTTMVLVALSRRQFRVAARTGDLTSAKPKIVADSWARRAVDIVVSGIALAIAGPVIVLLARLVRLTSRGPAFYRQVRTGRAVEQFTMLKLRSMVSGADQAGPLVTSRSDSRVTKLGALLRATKLDELPQLFNVLKGDMTLIGPRPEVPRFIPYYDDEELQILNVRPGLTGPGQIFYTEVQQAATPDSADPEQHYATRELHPKLAIDLDYLRHRGFGHDLQIVVRTALMLARLAKPAPAPVSLADARPAGPVRYAPRPDEDDTPTIVMVPYAPLMPDAWPTLLTGPQLPARTERERDDQGDATVVFGRYRPPVAHDGPAVRTGPQAPAPARAERERERDDQGDATVVFGRYRPPVAHDGPAVRTGPQAPAPAERERDDQRDATVVFGRYRPPVAHDGPAVRTGPQAPAPAAARERERERDDQGDATVVFGRYRPPVAHDEPTVIAASRPRPWSDDDEATIVMAPVPAVIGAAPTPAGPVGQVTQRTASRRAPDASSAQPTRPIAAAEALPATIAATGKRRNRHRGLTFLMLLAALVVLSIGGILVLWPGL